MSGFLDISKTFTIGMHGGGEIEGFQKTNTKEALDLWYGKGIRFFEFDVSETSDNTFVAFAHRLNQDYLTMVEQKEPIEGCSANWFSSIKLYPYSTKGLTTITLDILFKLLDEDPNLLLMLDLFAAKVEEIERFASYIFSHNKEIVSRVLVEIYHLPYAEILRNYNPALNIIYGIQPHSEIWPYENDSKVVRLNNDYLELLKDRNIQFISFQWHYRKNCVDGLKTLSEKGFFILSHKDSDIDSDTCAKENVNFLLVDYSFGKSYGITEVWHRWIVKKRAKVKFVINKFKRIGFLGSIKKIIKRIA